MDAASVVLLGFGQVGRAFVRLFLEKRERLRERYDIELNLKAVLTSRGGLMAEEALYDCHRHHGRPDHHRRTVRPEGSSGRPAQRHPGHGLDLISNI